MSDFLMPSLGADMESAKVAEWLVKPGAKVKKGDVIAVVDTHKGAIEVEIFQEGTIAELCAKEGDDVPVGGLLARLSAPGEIAAAKPAAAPPPARVPSPEVRPAAEAPRAQPPVVPPPAAPPPAAREGARAKVSPAARRRAAELGIDADALVGTGIDGSVTLADVELAAQTHAAPAAPAPAARAPVAEKPAPPHRVRGGFDPTEMRKAIAAAMSRSKREIPHYYLTTTIDLGASLSWIQAYNENKTPDRRLLPAVLLLKATALALRETPQLNGFMEAEGFRPAPGIHVGWAISLRGGGLVAPAIHDTDKKSLPELMTNLGDLVARARSGGLRSSELIDPTITITSLGERGADTVMGIIYPPQVAIVGFGRVLERPWIANGQIEKRPLVSVSLAADHRASDGHTGGMLLAAIDRSLQAPDRL